MATATLLLSCPDQKGLVATMADWVYRHDGNIVHADQHTDASEAVFFQRIEFDLEGFDLDRTEIVPALSPLLERFAMRCDVRFSDERPKVAVLVSKQAHCMYDLLARWRMGELEAEIPLVISNHPDHADVAAHFDVEFAHLPVTPESRIEQESAMLALLAEHDIDLVVLARYMQVLSAGFVAKYPNRIINIHHSFLPAFAGGRPYHQAHDRGVKLIGVTAHYATAELDEGPIIEQEVARVSHAHTPDQLAAIGMDLETVCLARAVRWHLEHRVLRNGSRTVVFT